MNSARGVLLLAAWAALAACALGCGKRSAAGAPIELVVPSAAASAPPVDHTLPGELAEGTEEAFGLHIPRRMNVTARFSSSVFASGELTPEAVSNYVRQRVVAAQIETGPAKTVFLRATSRTAPGRLMRIDVVGHNGTTELFVRDETKPADKQGLSPEERYRELGLTPHGAPLDPTRLE